MSELLSERAVTVIERAAHRREPFYLSLHFTAPHWPWSGPADGRLADPGDLPGRVGGSARVYAEMVRSLDTGVGRVLAALDRLALAGSTLVLFTSDNGGERFSHHGPLRGKKEDLLEGRYPGSCHRALARDDPRWH